MPDLPEPISRQDKLLHNIADGTPNIDDLMPVCREETYLKYIAENGSGGGSNVTVVQSTGSSSVNVMSQKSVTESLNEKVPNIRTINSKPLSEDIALTAEDIGALPSTTAIPSKTSDLVNDSGFLTEFTETDPTVPAWAKTTYKPKYTVGEINGAVPTSRSINSKKLTGNIVLDSSDIGAVPVERTINGKELSQNISLSLEDDFGLTLNNGKITYESLSSDVNAGEIQWKPVVSSVGAQYLKRFGPIVTLYIRCQLSEEICFGDLRICTLPVGFWPAADLMVGGYISTEIESVEAPGRFHINTSGAVWVRDDNSPKGTTDNPNNYNCACLHISFIAN